MKIEPSIESYPDTHQDVFSKTVFGFWTYIMTDCVLFATLFATFGVLHNNTFGGQPIRELLSLRYVLVETCLLLVSSFACGPAMMAARRNEKNKVIAWFGLAFILGASFVTMELVEFSNLVDEGYSWRRSGAMSSFFTLVGTHGLHVSIGLLFMLILVSPVIRYGITPTIFKRLTCLSMFWHFLDVIWIFIFSIVYLMGDIS